MRDRRNEHGNSPSPALLRPPRGDGFFVYILECRDGSLYTGWTTNIGARLAAHNGTAVNGAKYTRGRGPVKLVYFEEKASKQDAMKREAAIKKLTREKKLQLIASALPEADRE